MMGDQPVTTSWADELEEPDESDEQNVLPKENSDHVSPDLNEDLDKEKRKGENEPQVDNVGLRLYYKLGETVAMEEDQTHEFKGHRNVCTEEIPPWCLSAYDTSSRTRSAIARNVCGFLNTGLGGTVYVGILDSGLVVGSRLTPYQQQHLIVSLRDTLDRFRPPVPHHLYSVRFVPVLAPKDKYPKHRFPTQNDIGFKEHALKTHLYCWCDFEALTRYFHGLIPMNYVIEITVKPINKEDQWVKNLYPNSRISTQLVFQADDAQIYMRKHSTLVKYSIRDVVEQAKEEVLIRNMSRLLEAWKNCRTYEKMWEAVKKYIPEHEKNEIDRAKELKGK